MNESATESIELECKDCKRMFDFSEGEQTFFKEHLLHPPKRCPVCRLEKKQKYNKINDNAYGNE